MNKSRLGQLEQISLLESVCSFLSYELSFIRNLLKGISFVNIPSTTFPVYVHRCKLLVFDVILRSNSLEMTKILHFSTSYPIMDYL